MHQWPTQANTPATFYFVWTSLYPQRFLLALTRLLPLWKSAEALGIAMWNNHALPLLNRGFLLYGPLFVAFCCRGDI